MENPLKNHTVYFTASIDAQWRLLMQQMWIWRQWKKNWLLEPMEWVAFEFWFLISMWMIVCVWVFVSSIRLWIYGLRMVRCTRLYQWMTEWVLCGNSSNKTTTTTGAMLAHICIKYIVDWLNMLDFIVIDCAASFA